MFWSKHKFHKKCPKHRFKNFKLNNFLTINSIISQIDLFQIQTYPLYAKSKGQAFDQGLAILLIQAKTPSLMPPPCDHQANHAALCREASSGKAAMLFVGLYLVALGVGGIKGSLPSHGAEQFDDSTPQGRKRTSTFFNYFVFCLSCGGLVAVTLVVWLEDNKGWEWGFGIAMISIFLSVVVFFAGSPFYRNKLPNGSPFTTISKVHTP